LNLLECRDKCGQIGFRGISLLENGKRISEIRDQISGGQEKSRKCDEGENFSVLRWRGCDGERKEKITQRRRVHRGAKKEEKKCKSERVKE
jgi:hypothetical protein